jgi:hypothetical protein
MGNEKAGFVEHVTFELEIFLLDKLVNLQPMIKTELMARVMGRQAGLAFRLSVGSCFQYCGMLHRNLPTAVLQLPHREASAALHNTETPHTNGRAASKHTNQLSKFRA